MVQSKLLTVNQPEAPPFISVYDPFYPDSDGEPVANNTEQFELMQMLQGNLDALTSNPDRAFVAADLFWYPIEGNNKIVYAPDVLVAIGRPKGMRFSYRQWEERHQPPQVVFEIISPSNTQREMDRKLLFYNTHGVEEYYIYDPKSYEFRVWLRTEAGLDWVDYGPRWTSPSLGIHFELAPDRPWQIFTPDGDRFLTFQELTHQSIASRQQLTVAQETLRLAIAQLQTLGMSPAQIAETLQIPPETIAEIF
jgi:Uma2 family endonuclease